VTDAPQPRGDRWVAGPDDAGVRLDKYLADPDRIGSRRRAADAIERGKVFVNSVVATMADASRALVAGDTVQVWMDRPGSARKPSRPLSYGDLSILYEDDAIVVVNKPPGLLSVPLERREDAASVQSLLLAHLRSHGKRRPFVVHRIDRDTSGLVLFAQHSIAQRRLRQQFRDHEVERVYQTVVYGVPVPAAGTWRDHLVWDDRALIQKETHPRDPRGAEAVCHYRVIEAYSRAALLEIRLVTGKRNQIRLQARLRGHTLVGEQRYVYGPDELRDIPFGRQALHAQRLSFRHPVTGEPQAFEAPLPADFRDLIDRLRRQRRPG
jgi:23S rRNA pseudouridine1911/1915/1917 synthase